ncbi:MAG: hypothetical protein WBJ33_09125 [Candidatus Nanopelagicales bacterium]
MVRNTRRTSSKSAVALSALVVAGALVLSACSGGSGEPAATEAATEAAVVVPENAVPPATIGMHIEGVEGGAWASAPFGALRLWDNGTAWSQIETEKGVYNWANIDGSLANAQSKGMNNVMLVLGTTPEWATQKIKDTDYPQPGAAGAPKDLADWDNWVETVTTKYTGQFEAYQIWNEVNLKNFYNGTPAEMAEMTKRAYDIIKKNDPTALVVAPSPTLRLTAAFDRFYPEYLAELGKLGWPVDVFAIHTYPDGLGDPAVRGLLIKKAQEALVAAGAPDLPLWDTELNYGLAGPGDIPKQEITGANAAGFVVRTYIDDLRYNIDRSYWYIWSLRPIEILGIQAFAGSDSEQGFFALDNWVVGASFDGCATEGDAVICDFSSTDSKWIVAWAEKGEAVYTTPENSQLVCDPLQNCQEAGPNSTITLTTIPVRIYLS